jgi:apolipoprotein N-acyltransferase
MIQESKNVVVGWALAVSGLLLVAISLLLSFSTPGAIVFLAGLIALPGGIFLARMSPSKPPIRALIETVAILAGFVIAGLGLWWLGATVIGGE